MVKDLIQKFDSQNTYGIIKNFPDQILETVKIGKKIKINYIQKEQIKNIVISGLGGSAIGGDLIKTFLKDKIDIPIIVIKDYFLPKFVDEKTIVIISSYSGNTEETLSIYRDAIEKRSQIICITSGGKIKRISKENNHNLVIVPEGYQPRLALGFMFFSIMYILIHLRFLDEPSADISNIIELLKRRSEVYSDPGNENTALDLAVKLKNKLIIIYSTPCLESVGLRWRGQLSENSKVLSSIHTFPELNHNEIVAWSESAGLLNILNNSAIIILKDIDDFIRIKYRLEITKKILKSYTSNLFEFEGEGESILVRIFDLLYLIDWTSYYLAILNNVDPAEIKNIDYLKQQLALINNKK